MHARSGLGEKVEDDDFAVARTSIVILMRNLTLIVYTRKAFGFSSYCLCQSSLMLANNLIANLPRVNLKN
jgi:hypothetical protein